MKLPAETKTTAPSVDMEARWMGVTTDMIFADTASEFLRICDQCGRRFNREDATRRHRTLCEVVNGYPGEFRVQRAHAANNDPAFRLRYGHLLPRRPAPIQRTERRPGPTPDQRQAAADALAEEMVTDAF